MSDHVDAVRSALLASVSLGDDQTRTLAEAIAHTSEPGLRQVTLSLYNQLANDLSAQLADVDVVVQMVDGEPALVANPKRPQVNVDHTEAELDDDPVRTTVRLPSYLKNDVEAAAKSAGVSINTWIVDAIRGALHRPKPGTASSSTPFSSGSMSGWYS